MSERAMLSEREQRDRSLFDRISESYTRKDLLPPHRRARRLRLMQTLAAVGGVDGLRVLEVGCGAGFSADYLGNRPAEYVGIDYSNELIDVARHMNGGHGRRFEAANINDFDSGRPFDVVFMIGLLHHLDDPVRSLVRMTRLVVPGGVIVANEPQSGNPAVSWMRRIRKKIDSQYSDEQLEYGREALATMFSGAGLRDVRIAAQGLLSTPFAEVVFPLPWLAGPMSAVCCTVDSMLERHMNRFLHRLSWNLVVAGRVPHA